jgi:hypothetical protein
VIVLHLSNGMVLTMADSRRTVSISEEAYARIAARGKFGETVDDVLLRELPPLPTSIDPGAPSSSVPTPDNVATSSATSAPGSVRPWVAPVRGRGPNRSTRRLSPNTFRDGYFVLGWDGVEELRLQLPDKADRVGIAGMITEAKRWASEGGATHGQLNAIDKTASDAGYYRNGPRRGG